MDHTIEECGLKLSYLHGDRATAAVSRQRLFNDLLRGTPLQTASAWTVQPAFTAYDHLVLAHDLRTGVAVGFLGAQDHHASKASFLWLESGFVAETARGHNLLRRMIAVMLMRVTTLAGAPMAVATLTCNPVAVHVLQQLAPLLRGTRFAPAPASVVVDFDAVMLARDITAALGRRFEYAPANRLMSAGITSIQAGGPSTRVINSAAPMLAMLDLRNVYEAGLIVDLRKLYRAGPCRASRPSQTRLAPSIAGCDTVERVLKL